MHIPIILPYDKSKEDKQNLFHISLTNIFGEKKKTQKHSTPNIRCTMQMQNLHCFLRQNIIVIKKWFTAICADKTVNVGWNFLWGLFSNESRNRNKSPRSQTGFSGGLYLALSSWHTGRKINFVWNRVYKENKVKILYTVWQSWGYCVPLGVNL